MNDGCGKTIGYSVLILVVLGIGVYIDMIFFDERFSVSICGTGFTLLGLIFWHLIKRE